MTKKQIKNLFLLFFVFSVFFAFKNFSFAQTSSDAISIRVIPNPSHYSSIRWYREQGFVGTPQQLLIDGYDAVRNGNTVYVNAANITDTLPQTLYTNIYIISFNISANKETEDIFARILDNWKFNYNISSISGYCSPSFSSEVCILDKDCSKGNYCDSDKAETIRDTERLASIAEFNFSLNKYMEKNGHYPTLSAGTYLPNRTISTWPSWQGTFSKELGTQLSVDPINTMGDCSGYDEKTCWNEISKDFADPNPANTDFELPVGSRAFIYQASSDGSTFDICSEMESGFVYGIGSGACADGSATPLASPPSTATPTTPTTPTPTIPTVNHPPQIIFPTIVPAGQSGNVYSANIQAVEPDGDTTIWSIDTSMTTWTGWSSPPSLTSTANPNIYTLSAGTAGVKGTYDFSITINDGRGGVATKTFTITVADFPPIMNIAPMTHTASSTLLFSDSFTVSGNPTLTLNDALDQPLPSNFSTSFTPNGTLYDYAISGILTPNPLTNTMNHGVTPIVRNLTITDSTGVSNTKQIVINITNHKPVIQTPLSCQDRVRSQPSTFVPPALVPTPAINSLSIIPCDIDATDQEGNSYEFDLAKTTDGLIINPSTGVISGSPTSVGTHIIEIEATDEYGAISDPVAFNLTVDSYCGDNLVETPNSEGKGGPLDDGNEECDGLNGVAFTPADSSLSKMYACSGNCPSLNASCVGTCEFADKDNGGGFCGDGSVQTAFGENCDPAETKADYEARMGVTVNDYAYQVIVRSCVDCHNDCAQDQDFSRGCYLDTNNNGIIDAGECQKGMLTCSETGTLECLDVYTDIDGAPVFDYCCSGEKEKIMCANGNTAPGCAGVPEIGAFDIVRASPADVSATAGYYGTFQGTYANQNTYYNFYTCDYICKQTNQVCIGVGLNNHETMACTSVVHDMYINCLSSGNTVYDDCKSSFSLAGSSSASYNVGNAFNGYLGTCSDQSNLNPPLSPYFHVGEAACYCQ